MPLGNGLMHLCRALTFDVVVPGGPETMPDRNAIHEQKRL
jgi:hypothetical protein